MMTMMLTHHIFFSGKIVNNIIVISIYIYSCAVASVMTSACRSCSTTMKLF